MVKELTAASFDTEVLEANGKTMVDFWAPWCGPCRMLGPVIEQLADDKPEIKVCKVNIDDHPALAQRYGVQSIPTVIVFERGAEAARSVGIVSKEKLMSML